MNNEILIPKHVKLLQKSRMLEIEFSNGQLFNLSCEYLRAFSPSADKKKSYNKDVNIIGIDPVGQYGFKFIFDDGHQTGIYSFDKLYDLCINREQYWQQYLDKAPDKIL
jgi:DUF971 family protein